VNKREDYIFIEGLRIDAVIGIHSWEKAQNQPLIFDLNLTSEITTSSQSKDLADTTDYKQVADDIENWVLNNPTELLETLAENLCELIFANHPKVTQIEMKINKPHAIAKANATGLKIVRNRN